MDEQLWRIEQLEKRVDKHDQDVAYIAVLRNEVTHINGKITDAITEVKSLRGAIIGSAVSLTVASVAAALTIFLVFK